MPFVRVDACEGRSKEQVKILLDAIHRAVLSAFGVPLRDRYQVYQEHSESNFIVEDTGQYRSHPEGSLHWHHKPTTNGAAEDKPLYRARRGIDGLRYRTERYRGLHRYELRRRLELRQRKGAIPHGRTLIDICNALERLGQHASP
jgi:hypothetical protein